MVTEKVEKVEEPKEKELSFDEKITCVIDELVAPKGQYNDFGNYNYRSGEDILTAVKPLLKKYGLRLNLSDDIVLIGERYYVRATATLSGDDFGANKFTTTNAFAREPEAKKGMDGSQITGTASSYARKYALNAMFLIDDVKDADSNEYTSQNNRSQQKKSEPAKNQVTPKLTQPEINKLQASAKDLAELITVKTGKKTTAGDALSKAIINSLNKSKDILQLDVFESKSVATKIAEWKKLYMAK